MKTVLCDICGKQLARWYEVSCDIRVSDNRFGVLDMLENTGKHDVCKECIEQLKEESKKIEQIEREISYKEDFFKKHPNAEKDGNGDPTPCRKYIYGGSCPAHDDCHKCWNEIKDNN